MKEHRAKKNTPFFFHSIVFSYYLIRYEDLVSDPLFHLERLYAFAGLRFGASERETVLEHTQRRRGQEQEKRTKDEGYYSTFR